MKIFFIFFIVSLSLIAQPKFDFFSQANIKLFADHLFCEKDYLRAAEEYQKLSGGFLTDTVIFKTGLSYYFVRKFTEAGNLFSRIGETSKNFEEAQLQKAITGFRQNPEQFHWYYLRKVSELKLEKDKNTINKIYMISILLNKEMEITESEFFQPFNLEEKNQLLKYFEWKNNPPYKSPALAGILSTIIPGSGKIYTEEYGDGIVAFLTTGLLTFLAYNNFRANHNTRGWIFTSLAGLFYAGNIYGSVASAQIYNARFAFEFTDGINLFLEKNNYFSPEYEFCK